MDEPDNANEVLLRGRVSGDPTVRTLPSGDSVLVFRLVVRREGDSPMTRESRQVSDWVDCSVWGGRVRSSVARWGDGDRVALRGALRRRFYRTPAGSATRLEVEVLSGRRVRGAKAGATQSGRARAR